MDNSNILLSRNSPVALVIGASGFIGSHVSEQLLKAGIQVVGVDDFSSGDKQNLENCTRNKRFFFLNKSINEPLSLNIERLDYAFFIADSEDQSELYGKGLINFLRFIKFQREKEAHFEKLDPDKKQNKIRVVFVSSISLYKKEISSEDSNLKQAEVEFAKFVKGEKINARIVRLSAVFGPRMNFREKDAFFRLLKAYLNGNLQSEDVQSDLATRAIFISDAVSCILKTVFLGSTSHKIFDAASLKPLKVTDIRQILLDPLWFENLHIEPEPLSSWPTPNLKRTIKELAWSPKKNFLEGLKETVRFFNAAGLPEEIKEEKKETIIVEEKPRIEPEKEKPKEIQIKEEISVKKENKQSKPGFLQKVKLPKFKFKQNLFLLLGGLIIFFGIVLPILGVVYGAVSTKAHIQNSKDALAKGDFDKAYFEIDSAEKNVSQMQDLVSSLAIAKKISFLEKPLNSVEKVLNLSDEGIEGVRHSAKGLEALYESTKVMSGETKGEPGEYFKTAQVELSGGSAKLSRAALALQDKSLTEVFPEIIEKRLNDLSLNLTSYSALVEKAKVASYLLPQITAVGDKKVYLILFQNNTELRPTGGFIGSYARVEFENGKIKNIKVDDIYNLDGALKDHIEPPTEIKNDLGQKDWFLRDSNFEPDFPTSARQVEFFYNKEAGERVHGVIAMDLTAAGKLIDSVGGLNLSDYNETVTKENLFANSFKHSEVDFFPGSTGKRNYLTSLQNSLFNKVFFDSNQNWPAIVSAMGEALEEKHMQIYVSDPQVFSYIASQNWAGILPRESERVEGETQDMLAVVEANLGANKSNYYLERNFKLDTVIGKENEVFHNLEINYINNSPSLAFPAGAYKNRLRIYLPNATKLNKLMVNGIDLTSQMNPLSDYGRTYYSLLVEVPPKEKMKINFEYVLLNPLSFKDDTAKYRLDVIKQAGTLSDPFEWNLSYPINLEAKSEIEGVLTGIQELNAKTTLTQDRTFLIDFKKL